MDTKLRRLQLTQLEILKLIDQICRKNNITYSLYAGALLGAVRHQGFIPWDDDLDICMIRADYQRFLQIWVQEQPIGYILQNKENSPKFSQSFSKVRKDHTCFLETEWEIGRYHTGIYVDIFPIDRIPVGRINQRLFQWHCLEYLLLTREYIPAEGSVSQKALARIVLEKTPEKQRPAKREKLLNQIMYYNADETLPAIATETLNTVCMPLPVNFMTDVTDLSFEDGSFMCSAFWHEYLTVKFGDYMKLPPEKERTWRHHPVILDFNHNYEELMKEEKQEL